MLRGAVIGLGMMGRHHARLLQYTDEAEFAGAVDPGGDRFRAVHDPGLVFASIDDLLTTGRVDFAIVCVPTEVHLPAVAELSAAGVSVLVEKPLAATIDQAREIVRLCSEANVHGAVGHVERFNPALQELRRRLLDGQVGRLFSVSTERTGPFPSRVQDVGVVKDLASHDIDLVSWLSDSRIASVSAQVQYLTGREHEDHVLACGALESGASFSLAVDWVSPRKVRRTRVLGERGMLEADTLTGDLYFYENAEVGIVWSAAQQFRGVSEGNVTRYALQRREPLAVEHEAFINLVAGRPGADMVSLAEGVEIVTAAEAVRRSARDGDTVHLAGRGVAV
jgi:UDP-N-acetylglucosamine 3-dehydrogenase